MRLQDYINFFKKSTFSEKKFFTLGYSIYTICNFQNKLISISETNIAASQNCTFFSKEFQPMVDNVTILFGNLQCPEIASVFNLYQGFCFCILLLLQTEKFLEIILLNNNQYLTALFVLDFYVEKPKLYATYLARYRKLAQYI